MTERKLYLGLVTDSRRWDHIALRPDDIIVATPPKSGTTWMQTILALLLQGSTALDPELPARMVWVDARMREVTEVAADLAARSDRRVLKSHTPLDGLPIEAEPTYITVFRHPLDVHFSFRKHVRNMPTPWFHPFFPEEDPDGFTFRRFLDGGAEGYDTDVTPLAHILQHYRCAMALAERPNVHLFHYADMKRDLAGTFARVAGIVGVSHPTEVMEELVQAATFDNMKQNAERLIPAGGRGFWKSDAGFFDSGTHGKWHGLLSQEELAAYDRVMDASLSKEERGWLEYGEQRAR